MVFEQHRMELAGEAHLLDEVPDDLIYAALVFD
jgi:hypothetical protein